MKTAENEVKKCFAKALKEYREQNSVPGNKMTQTALAKKLGFSLASIQRWERDTVDDMPSPDQIVKIANLLDITVDQLLTGVASKNVDVHRITGLSDKTINTLRNRDAVVRLYLKTVIEPLLDPETMVPFACGLLDITAVQEESESDNLQHRVEENIIKGIRWSILERIGAIIDKAPFVVHQSSLKNEELSVLLKNAGLRSALSDFGAIQYGEPNKK